MLVSNLLRTLNEPYVFNPFFSDFGGFHSPKRRREKFWTSTLELSGFLPNEVSIKQEANAEGKMKVIVHAKHVEGDDDFMEVRRSVKVPTSVDQEKMRTIMTDGGHLILKAPYKEATQSDNPAMTVERHDTWDGVWKEIERLNNDMSNVMDWTERSNMCQSEFVQSENGVDGTWRLKLNIGKGFNANDMKLTNENGRVLLEAKKEVKSGNSSRSHYVSESFLIPDGVDQDKMVCKVSEKGDLIIEAPAKRMPSIGKAEAKSIPITLVQNEDSVDNKMMTET